MSALLRNLTWLGAASAVSKPLWFFFITAACMRFLGVDGYGVLTASLALAGVGLSFTDLGMVRHTVREVARDRSSADELLTNLLLLRIALGLLAVGIVLAVAYVLEYRDREFLAVVFGSLYTFLLTQVNYFRGYYEAIEDLKRGGIMLVLEKIAVVGIGVVCLVATRQPEWTLAGMAAGMGLALLLNLWWITGRIARFRLRLISRQFLTRTLRIMIPVGIGGIFFATYFRIDLVMVEAMISARAVGQYGAAYRILEALNMVPTVIVVSALYPRLARLLGQGRLHEYGRLFVAWQALLLVASLVAVAVLSAWAADLIQLLSPGDDFAASAPALRLLVWALPLLSMNGLMYSSLLALHDDRFATLILGAAVVCNVSLNLWRIPEVGIMGAAEASVATEVLLLVAFALRYANRWRRMQLVADRDRSLAHQHD